jgi:uroporphyrinogen decarboxylase
MTGKERVETVLSWEKPDRIPVFEHLWSETVQDWRQQGLPEEADPATFFEYDFQNLGWFDQTLQLPVEQIDDDGTYITERNANGVLLRRHKTESGHTPHWLEHLINDRSDWEKHRHRLEFNEKRIDPNLVGLSQELRKTGRYLCLAGCEPYESFWPVFGQVGIFQLMLDDPDLIAEVFSMSADLVIRIIDHYAGQGVEFDGVWFYGDMGYRNGTLFSPECYDRMLAEPHKRLCDHVHGLGKKVILHSCGRIKGFIPRFIEAGFDVIQPLEAKCEQDVRDLRAKHGKSIVLFGNMDVRKLSGTRRDVEEEVLTKLEAVAHEGGYLFHSDHSIPPTVSFENYQYALKLVRDFVP